VKLRRPTLPSSAREKTGVEYFALLVFALEQLKLGKPLIHGIRDFRPSRVIQIVNHRYVGIESFEVCLLAPSGGDRFIKVVANVFPGTGAVSQRVPQEVGTGEIGGAAPTSEIDFLIAPSLAFADLAIECDCHLASKGKYRAGSKMIEIW